MAISMDLRVLARKLEKNSDDLLINASTKGPEEFEKVATAIAAASTLLEGVADDMDQSAEFSITPRQLDEIAALASAFDESEDPLLKKQASVLDELLLSIAAPKNAAREARKVSDDEINRIREERRKSRREEAYEEPRKAHADMNNAKEQAKAVAQQVKRYRPLEAPLQTRYPPDRPGGQMTRITDHVYQDIVTGIVYDFKAGYTTQKGNEIPGTSVENQTRQLGDSRNQSTSLFEDRQSLMGRYASDGDLYHIKKYAMGNEIARALKITRDLAPELLDKAIAYAQQDGLSTSEIGEILSDVASVEEGARAFQSIEGPSGVYSVMPMTERESADEYEKALSLFDAFAAAGWSGLIADHLEAIRMAGLHNEHLSKLERNFFGAEPYQTEVSPDSIEIAPESLQFEEDIPFSKAPGDTMISAAKNRHGLIAVALGAVQELAPHLLTAAVVKAKVDGLTDQQIRSILASGFNTKFKKTSFSEDSEVKAAESLFPQLRALGWNSLVQDHLKVMTRFGVSYKTIQKLACVKTSTFDELKSVLKQAVFTNQPFEFIEEPPQTVREPQTWNWEDEEDPETIKQQPKAAPVAPVTAPKAKTKTPKVTPVADWEFVNEPAPEAAWEFVNEPVAPVATPVKSVVEEEAPFSLLTEMFGDTPKPPAVKGPVTPLDDPEEWGKVLAAVKSEIAADQSVKDKIQEFRLAGKKEDSYAFVKQLINERMNAQGFAGAYEKDPSGVEWIIVAEKGGVKTPSEVKDIGVRGTGKRFNWTNYQSLNKMPMSDSDIEDLENKAKDIWAREGEKYSALMEKFKFTGNEIPAVYASLPPEIKKQLDTLFIRGEGSTAVRGILDKIVDNYIKEHAEQFLQERISELSGKADELFEESSKLEAKGRSAQAQTKLDMAAQIKDQINNPEELLKNTIKTKKEQLMLTEKDLMAARKGLRSNDKAAAAEIRREALTELNKQSINQALKEKGLPPMFDNVNVMSLARFAEKLQEIGKIETVVKEEAKRARTLGKKPSLLIHELPKNKQTGEPMKTPWEDPEFYLETIKEVSEEYPLPDIPRKTEDKRVKEQKLNERKGIEKIWNNLFEERGLVGPFQKLFGSGPDWEGTIASGLNLRPDKVDLLQVGDLLPNTVINGHQLKTILTDPEEYANHWLEGKAKFGPEFQWKLEPILEMNQIHGGTPKINAPAKLISFVKSRMDKGQDLDNLKVELMAKGVPVDLTENVWNEIKGSGDTIRKRLFGGLAGGAEKIIKGQKTPEEVIDDLLNNPRNGIMTKSPDAYIPPGVMQALLKQLTSKLKHNNQVKSDWNKWSLDQGFWPPYSRLLGRSSTADLLKGGSGYRNPDPDAVGGTPMAELDLD
jgi:hypothetical protein